ncbi:MAG: GGDEF domain-containing protein [Epsilonproteobacteria bacterium]|nr:MAG: GGDEF domain-containing protein [Campylobacterota bacterium]
MANNLNYRLLALPIVVIIAMLGLSFLFSQKIQILKKEVDLIYFGNFVPVHKLHLIQTKIINKIDTNKISSKSKKIISKDWKEYNKQYKTISEKIILKKINIHFNKALKTNKKKYYKVILKDILYLIKHEVTSASVQRKKFLLKYQQMQNYLFYSQMSIIVFVIILMGLILYQFLQQQRRLSLLNEQYKIEANTDGLTGLYNRKYFDTIFDDLTSISQHNNWNSVFVMIDIDFFKQYNDTYGHDAGDIALQKVASVLEMSCDRDMEYTFRLGGEEFGIIIFNASVNYVKTILKTFQDNILQLHIEHSSSATKMLTVSMGVVLIDKTTYKSSPKELYISADKKLYHSKENGRNQYTI